MKIGIGNDHAAVEMKMQIKEFIESMGHEVVNYGVDTTESCNYPEIGERVGRAVADKEVDCAVLICGTGVGISIAANKVKGVRCALCTDPYLAKMTRLHNDANMLALGGGITGKNLALEIVDTFLDTEFSQGENHIRRISKIEK